MVVEGGVGKVSQACRAMSLNRATFYKASLESDHSRVLRKRMIDLIEEQPSYGIDVARVRQSMRSGYNESDVERGSEFKSGHERRGC